MSHSHYYMGVMKNTASKGQLAHLARLTNKYNADQKASDLAWAACKITSSYDLHIAFEDLENKATASFIKMLSYKDRFTTTEILWRGGLWG
jgi:hypothetical protein